jgi:hypothetical protein
METESEKKLSSGLGIFSQEFNVAFFIDIDLIYKIFFQKQIL